MKTTIHTLKNEYKDNQTYLNEKQIEEIFVVSDDIFREDRVLKIIKEVLKNNSIFKAIKGEFSI